MTAVPFNRPLVAPRQVAYLERACASGQMAGDGPFSAAAAKELSALHDGHTVLLTPSCTAALELSALLIDLEPGDEVIVPSFTFSSTASAFALMGARIVFADVEPTTGNLAPDEVAELIGARTRAIVPVHYGGTPCSPTIHQLAAEHGLVVVEDNAHGLFARHRDGAPLGTIGQLATLSFHNTKNVTCGEGGALIVNDPAMEERAEILREKGTDRAQFLRGQVDHYSWRDLGSSYLLSDLGAAVVLAQLEAADDIQRRRGEAWRHYDHIVGEAADAVAVDVLRPEPGCVPSDHLFALLLPDLATRSAFIDELADVGVAAAFHYVPLHSSVAGRRVGTAPLGCPVADELSDRLVRLPLFSDITPAEYERVAEVASEALIRLLG